ncbi:MAG: UrcA family protein [Gammaproteobacteria bacterium]
MRTKTSLLLLSFLAATASSVAAADTVVNVKSEVVRFDDIRLISPVGAAVLYGRLHNAAVRACGGPISGPTQLAREQRFNACTTDAVRKAVDSVNHPVLSQYYASRNSVIVPGGADDKSVTAAR